ncbi:MAG TPA: hypothetical protein VJ867_16250 [Gemmatimonadaceae bacterium]|nr:hypothetical protein [Gemmatimonadaceae bacterium]
MHTLTLIALSSLLGSRPTLPGHVVDVYARDFFFRAPDTIPAGLTTLRLHVQQGAHIAVLMRLDSGHTAADLLRSRREGNARPAWVHMLGGPGFPAPNGTANATLALEPGSYVLMCDVEAPNHTRHFEMGMFHQLVVRSMRDAPYALPADDAVITVSDHAFEISAPLRAGSRVLRVVNGGSVMHELRLVRVLPGHTGRESIQWKPGDDTPRPDEDVTAIVGLMPAAALTTTVALAAGEYVAFDVAHVADGLLQIVHVLPR